MYKHILLRGYLIPASLKLHHHWVKHPKISRFRTCRSSVSLASLRAHAALHQSFRSSHKSMKAAGFISVSKRVMVHFDSWDGCLFLLFFF